MPTLDLTDQEWQALTVMLADMPWKVANPILFKMANVMRDQIQTAPVRPDGEDRVGPDKSH